MQFRFGSIPVRVHMSFFVMTLVLGATGARDPASIAIWVGIVAVSIFAHELGHALMGRAFGLAPSVELYAMGGLTSFAGGKPLSNGKKILISLAGPGVGLFVAGAALGAGALGLTPNVLGEHGGSEALAVSAAQTVIFVNGYWSLFNLLPMLPLDGGNVTLYALNAFTSGKGERAARIVSLVVSILVGLAALSVQWIWVVILCLSFAVQNGRMLGQSTKVQKDDPLREVLAKAVADLNTGNARGAISGAELVASNATSAELKLEALRILSYALVADGRWSQLMHLLEGGLVRAIADDDLSRFENAARSSGSREVADSIAGMRAERTHAADVRFNAG
jgi:Zn-dependent protease